MDDAQGLWSEISASEYKKNIVAAGPTDRVEVQVAYVIGVAHPLSVNVETFGTAKIPDEKIASLINEFFDLRPGAIIRDLGLRNRSTARQLPMVISVATISNSSGNAPIRQKL